MHFSKYKILLNQMYIGETTGIRCWYRFALGSLEVASHHEDRLDCPHAEIVMVILRELLGGKLVELNHLGCQVLSTLEPLSEEHHLSYLSIGRDHHRNRSEKDL